MQKFNLILVIISVWALMACQAGAATPEPTSPPPTVPATVTPLPIPQNQPPTPTVVPIRPRAAVAQGGVATLGIVGPPPTLNPITENNPVLRQIAPLLFDSLLQADPVSAELRPGLAESWDYSDDGSQVTFFLSPDLTWSDGTPLTAAQVVASLQATQHPALLKFSQIRAVDNRTLTLEFINIDCAAVTSLALLPLLPAAQILDPQPMGSGPFVVDGWSDDGQTLLLGRNGNRRGGGALLDGLAVHFIAPENLKIVLSEGAGQFDAIGPVIGPVTPPPNFDQQTFTAPELLYVAVNYAPKNEPPLPAAVRQALPQAIDRQTILNEILAGDGQLLAGTLLPGHWAASGQVAPPAYNPDAARALLRRAGLRDTDGDGWLDSNGQRLDLTLRLNGKNPREQELGWLVSSYYRDLGLYARAESVPPDSLIDDLFTHDFQLAIFSWPLLPDPDQRMFWHSRENTEGIGLNFTSYSNPKLDTLMEQAVAVPGCQTQRRADFYGQAQQLLNADRPVDVVLAPHWHVFTAGRLHGPSPGPFAPLTWNAADWYLTEKKGD